MNIPEEMKIKPNTLVVFKKYFEFNGVKVNAITQLDDGTTLVFDTEHYHTDTMAKIDYKTLKATKEVN